MEVVTLYDWERASPSRVNVADKTPRFAHEKIPYTEADVPRNFKVICVNVGIVCNSRMLACESEGN